MYELTQAAANDIERILEDSYQEFGEEIAFEYLLSLKDTFLMLSEQPTIGRKIDTIRKDYHRHEHKKHTIFYKILGSDILIVRVLHQSMDIERHI